MCIRDSPSHRRKRLLIYRRCRYLFIFRYLLIVVLVIYSLLKMVAEKEGVPEAEVVQNRQFIYYTVTKSLKFVPVQMESPSASMNEGFDRDRHSSYK